MSERVSLGFDAKVQSLDVLHAAAYRLVSIATCEFTTDGDRILCHLTPKPSAPGKPKLDADDLRSHFFDLVADENVRADISRKTEPVRNLILSLAFGSLAHSGDEQQER